MSSRPSTTDLVARIDSEADGIDGLITVAAGGAGLGVSGTTEALVGQLTGGAPAPGLQHPGPWRLARWSSHRWCRRRSG
jgi:hypothetical protein